ncbi:hypothetical protein [Thiocapsa sp.]|uniref:hypothetical protein n=1 Tax=Thiocapsa sp. TaxID=2024551 RepID=UPI003592EB76
MSTITDWRPTTPVELSGWYRVYSPSTGREGWARYAVRNLRAKRVSDVEPEWPFPELYPQD